MYVCMYVCLYVCMYVLKFNSCPVSNLVHLFSIEWRVFAPRLHASKARVTLVCSSTASVGLGPSQTWRTTSGAPHGSASPKTRSDAAKTMSRMTRYFALAGPGQTTFTK